MNSTETHQSSIRRASRADARRVAEIYNQHVDVGGATFDAVHWSPDAVAKLIDHPAPEGWYVADLGGTVVGWASARRVSDRYGYRHTCETSIYLSNDAIGTGLADHLQRQIERHCLDNRVHHAVAKIIADNGRSIRFHQRWGYEMVGIQREIGRMGGRWVDVAILQRLFHVAPQDDP